MNPQSISGSCKEGLDCVCSRNDALASWVTISMRLGAWFFRKNLGRPDGEAGLPKTCCLFQMPHITFKSIT